jgi:TolA-binding protein
MSVPPTNQGLTHDQIRVIYNQSQEAVIELVEGLLSQLAELQIRVERLENQKSKDSHNSSKTPSSDRFKPRSKSLRRESECPGDNWDILEAPSSGWKRWMRRWRIGRINASAAGSHWLRYLCWSGHYAKSMTCRQWD